MGIENEEVPDLDKVMKKPSLHTRLQSGTGQQNFHSSKFHF